MPKGDSLLVSLLYSSLDVLYCLPVFCRHPVHTQRFLKMASADSDTSDTTDSENKSINEETEEETVRNTWFRFLSSNW